MLRRDAHRCAYCGGGASTIDHVLPRSRGGADSWENLVACCLRCNNVKGDRTPQEILGASTEFIDKIGLRAHLSPNRANGLSAMIDQMKRYALAYSSTSRQGE